MTKVYVKRMGNNEVVKEIEVRYAYDSSNYDLCSVICIAH